MFVKKIHELEFYNNDIFRLAPCHNTIIVNHDYQGIDLLDDSLKILQTIPISSYFIAWAIYKKYNSNTILIHDPNSKANQNQFTIINVDTLEINTCNPGPLANQCFTKNYYWQENILILIAEETNSFCFFDINNAIFKEITHDDTKKIAPDFFVFWQKCETYKAITAYPEQKALIAYSNNTTLTFFDFCNNKSVNTPLLSKKLYEANYKNDLFVLEYSAMVEIKSMNHSKIIKAKEGFYFLETCILENNKIVTLQTNSNNHEICTIEIYQTHTVEDDKHYHANTKII